MHVSIAPEPPDSPEAIGLIDELQRYIAPMYPHDREHGLSPAEMAREGVAFFVLRTDGQPAGCGALKPIGPGSAEIMRMYVRPPFRGKGLGRQMLQHLEGYAMEHGHYGVTLENRHLPAGSPLPVRAVRVPAGSGVRTVPRTSAEPVLRKNACHGHGTIALTGATFSSLPFSWLLKARRCRSMIRQG